MLNIKYHNTDLKKIINNYITETKYGEFVPILEEILERRAFEYGFSLEQMENQIKNLSKNLNGIIFANDEIKEELGIGTLAAFSKQRKQIFINTDSYDMLCDIYNKKYEPSLSGQLIGYQMYSLLTHEVYHAIVAWDDRNLGLMHKDEFDMWTGKSLDEIVTESAAVRTVREKGADVFEKGYANTLGYDEITSMSNLIANSIGCSQKEFLANSLNNREQFEKFIFQKLPENMSERRKKQAINQIVFKSALILDILTKNQDMVYPCFEASYASMFNLAQDTMKYEEPTMEDIGAMYYRFAIMVKITKSSVENLVKKGFLKKEDSEKLLTDSQLSEQMIGLGNTVLDKYKQFKGDEFEEKRPEEIEQLLLLDMLKNPEYVKKSNELISDDYSSKTNWDNSIFQYVNMVLKKEREKVEKSFLEVTDTNIEDVISNITEKSDFINLAGDKTIRTPNDDEDAR